MAKRASDLRKDMLAGAMDDLRDILRDDESLSFEEMVERMEDIFSGIGLPVAEEKTYTITVTAKFMNVPDDETIRVWVQEAFEVQYDRERCVFPDGYMQDNLTFRVEEVPDAT